MGDFKNFKEIEINLQKPKEITCCYLEHKEESFSIFKISGKIPDGSQGKNCGLYIYQSLVLAIITEEPNAVLVDLREFTYNYGTAIIPLLEVFSKVKIFDDDEVLSAFILSDKNKYGFASLCQFDVDNPGKPFFLDFDKGYHYLFDAYDKI